MSQHCFECRSNEGYVTVMLGWDEALQWFHMFIGHSCRRGIKFHTKQSSNPVCTVLNDTHPEIKIHTNSYYKI